MKRLLKSMDIIIIDMQLLKYTLLAFTSFKVNCKLYYYFVLLKLDNFFKVYAYWFYEIESYVLGNKNVLRCQNSLLT